MTNMWTDKKVQENKFYLKTVELTGKIYSNQIGWFPTTSSKGNKYIMVIYNHNSNAILACLLKIKSSLE